MGRMWIQKSLTLAGAVVLATACSESPNSPNTPPIQTKNLSIEGQIDTGVGASGFSMKIFGPNDFSSFAGEEKKVRCVPGSGPLVAGEGIIHATTGAFSLQMKGMEEGASLGCWIFVDGIPSMPISFGAKDSIYGGSQQLLGYAPKPGSTSLKLGTIAIATVGGFSIAIVNKDNINDNGSTGQEVEFYDMKGEWSATPITGNGFIHPCDMDELNPAELTACKNEWKQKIYFNQKITATNTADQSTSDISTVWKTKSAFDHCGGKEGLAAAGYTFSPAQAGQRAPFSLDLSNLSENDLKNAKFAYSKYGNDDNCHGVDETQCKAAKNCYELIQNVPIEEQEIAGLSCTLSSLKSGGNKNVQFDFGTSCDYRLRDYPNDLAPILDGSACATDGMCGLEFYPRERFLHSELVISGNMGTTSQTEEDTGHVGDGDDRADCHIVRTHTFTITQVSKSKATLQVDFTSVLKPGQDPRCATDPTTWFYDELSGRKIFVNLSK